MPSWRVSLANFGFCNGSETRDSRDRNMTRNSWRRTAFESISGDVEIAPDDWTLLDPSGEPLARLYKVMGGPQDGRWYWTVLFMPDGSVGNGGAGFVDGRQFMRSWRESLLPLLHLADPRCAEYLAEIAAINGDGNREEA